MQLPFAVYFLWKILEGLIYFRKPATPSPCKTDFLVNFHHLSIMSIGYGIAASDSACKNNFR